MSEPLTEIDVLQRALQCYLQICADRVGYAQKLVECARQKDQTMALQASKNVLARQQHEHDIVQRLIAKAMAQRA